MLLLRNAGSWLQQYMDDMQHAITCVPASSGRFFTAASYVPLLRLAKAISRFGSPRSRAAAVEAPTRPVPPSMTTLFLSPLLAFASAQ